MSPLPFKSAVAVFLAITFAASTIFAQQPQSPSQRFSPRPITPPSVHVPNSATRQLRAGDSNQRPSRQATRMNISDVGPAASRRNAHQFARPGASQTNRQVSFDQAISPNKNQTPEIPAILRGRSKTEESATQQSGIQQPSAQRQESGQFQPPTGSQPPVIVNRQEFENHSRTIEKQLSELKQRRQIELQPPSALRGEVISARHDERPDAGVQVVQYQQDTTGPANTDGLSNGFQASRVGMHNADRIVTSDSSAMQRAPMQNHIRQVSGNEMSSGPSVDLSSPAIRVQAFGPAAIGINKLATYKVIISNDSPQESERLNIGIKLPEWIDLQNINITSGHHEITDGVDQARLNWTVDRIPAHTTQTMAINAIPRSAEPFDMEVQWAFAPQTGRTRVQVTQPNLEMKISGPTEVLFGEKVTYDVSISNPGTGTAENVNVMLTEALGGESSLIGNIAAGAERKLKVELYARTAGQLILAATAAADGDVDASANHQILVRRANLNVSVEGPRMKYAGSAGQYTVTIVNDGDATATEVMGVLALPSGVKYLSGMSSADVNESGLKWDIGTMTAGDRRTFQINCDLNASGELLFQAGARGAGELAASGQCTTRVDTIADLTLQVEDPQGPLPTGDNITYKLRIKNRGTRSANAVDVVVQFSEGIEPIKASGFKNSIKTGQVIFAPINRIEPGQEIVLDVTAQALKAGTHIFRAQLTCSESDSREIAEGTTRFFGDDVTMEVQELNFPAKANTADASNEVVPNTNDFK